MTSLNTPDRNPLLIPDTLQSILDCVEEHRTLFALAQTCRSISGPSLDRLWRELWTLHPLIRCVRPIERNDQGIEEDEDVEQNDEDAEEDEDWEDDDWEDEGSELEGLDPPTPAEWAVVERYSHRVQELSILEDSLSHSFLKSIGSQPFPLFPNLRVLIWQWEFHPRPGSIAWIYPLLSPTLVTLQARLTDRDGGALRSFLQRYPHHCRSLKTVAFAFPSRQSVAQTTIYELSRAVCSHDKLVKLSVHRSPIDAAAMRQISLSPTIEDLSVEHIPQRPIPRPFFRPRDTPFRHLGAFQLSTSDLDFVATLLGSRDQTFSTLNVQLREQPTVEALSTFFSTLASSSSYTESIRSLLFQSTPPFLLEASPAEEEAHVLRLSYQSLLPLMSFSHLRTLLIDLSDQISLDDDELVNMARSWPSMESLKIRCEHGEHPPRSVKYITLQGLLQLIVFCPKLREFSLPLDATQVPTDTDPNVRNTAIQYLCLHESPAYDPHAVASFISKHFPSVSNIAIPFPGPDGHTETLAFGWASKLW